MTNHRRYRSQFGHPGQAHSFDASSELPRKTHLPAWPIEEPRRFSWFHRPVLKPVAPGFIDRHYGRGGSTRQAGLQTRFTPLRASREFEVGAKRMCLTRVAA